VWTDAFLWRAGGAETRHAQTAPAVDGALEGKRMRKRAVKTGCYALMKRITGVRPPWGSLTGIRPTRLYYEQLATGATPEQAEAALISLFDLRPDKAALLGEAVRSQRGLTEHEPDAVDIYLGIPFCTTRCAYCSFVSGEIGDGKLVEPYLAALAVELAGAAALVREVGLRTQAIYVGGGTPTALSCVQLARVLEALWNAFPGAEEWTVEAGRPDTLDADKLAMLRTFPVTRISINPQTLQDATLARIGRAHTGRQTELAYALAREAGFDHINMDLICALPGEDEAAFADTLARAALLEPESLTVHTLALKRASRLRGGAYASCGPDTAQRMVEMGREAARTMGMRAYYLYRQKYMAGNLENVGYAKPGRACRYNIDIMEETTSVLALGAGGISKRVFGAEARIERAPNVSDVGHYVARVEEMIERKRTLWRPSVGDGDR
jgi:oxygen-independent coproporphyrinogen-3 oxidase